MSEIRFSSDTMLEEKIDYLMGQLKMKSKKDLFTYLLNKQYEAVKEGQKKNV